MGHVLILYEQIFEILFDIMQRQRQSDLMFLSFYRSLLVKKADKGATVIQIL
jgi:hypothetical protein